MAHHHGMDHVGSGENEDASQGLQTLELPSSPDAPSIRPRPVPLKVPIPVYLVVNGDTGEDSDSGDGGTHAGRSDDSMDGSRADRGGTGSRRRSHRRGAASSSSSSSSRSNASTPSSSRSSRRRHAPSSKGRRAGSRHGDDGASPGSRSTRRTPRVASPPTARRGSSRRAGSRAGRRKGDDDSPPSESDQDSGSVTPRAANATATKQAVIPVPVIQEWEEWSDTVRKLPTFRRTKNLMSFNGNVYEKDTYEMDGDDYDVLDRMIETHRETGSRTHTLPDPDVFEASITQLDTLAFEKQEIICLNKLRFSRPISLLAKPCCVCNSRYVTMDNAMVTCSSCDVRVHIGCAGVAMFSGEYRCERCEALDVSAAEARLASPCSPSGLPAKKSPRIRSRMVAAAEKAAASPLSSIAARRSARSRRRSSMSQVCPLCGGGPEQGIMRASQAPKPAWVHASCALWHGFSALGWLVGSEVELPIRGTAEAAIMGMESCGICDSKVGLTLHCQQNHCSATAHVSCAIEEGSWWLRLDEEAYSRAMIRASTYLGMVAKSESSGDDATADLETSPPATQRDLACLHFYCGRHAKARTGRDELSLWLQTRDQVARDLNVVVDAMNHAYEHWLVLRFKKNLSGFVPILEPLEARMVQSDSRARRRGRRSSKAPDSPSPAQLMATPAVTSNMAAAIAAATSDTHVNYAFKAMVVLRQRLDKARTMCDMLRRRERFQSELVSVESAAFEKQLELFTMVPDTEPPTTTVPARRGSRRGTTSAMAASMVSAASVTSGPGPASARLDEVMQCSGVTLSADGTFVCPCGASYPTQHAVRSHTNYCQTARGRRKQAQGLRGAGASSEAARHTPMAGSFGTYASQSVPTGPSFTSPMPHNPSDPGAGLQPLFPWSPSSTSGRLGGLQPQVGSTFGVGSVHAGATELHGSLFYGPGAASGIVPTGSSPTVSSGRNECPLVEEDGDEDEDDEDEDEEDEDEEEDDDDEEEDEDEDDEVDEDAEVDIEHNDDDGSPAGEVPSDVEHNSDILAIAAANFHPCKGCGRVHGALAALQTHRMFCRSFAAVSAGKAEPRPPTSLPPNGLACVGCGYYFQAADDLRLHYGACSAAQAHTRAMKKRVARSRKQGSKRRKRRQRRQSTHAQAERAAAEHASRVTCHCPLCGRGFVNAAGLGSHSKFCRGPNLADGDGSNSPQNVRKRVSRRKPRRKQARTAEELRAFCSVCHKGFPSGRGLGRHELYCKGPDGKGMSEAERQARVAAGLSCSPVAAASAARKGGRPSKSKSPSASRKRGRTASPVRRQSGSTHTSASPKSGEGGEVKKRIGRPPKNSPKKRALGRPRKNVDKQSNGRKPAVGVDPNRPADHLCVYCQGTFYSAAGLGSHLNFCRERGGRPKRRSLVTSDKLGKTVKRRGATVARDRDGRKRSPKHRNRSRDIS